MSTSKSTHYFAKGNSVLAAGQPDLSAACYVEKAFELQGLYTQFEGNLTLAKLMYNRQRSKQLPRLAVCGWSMSHNPSGRVITLIDAYRPCLITGQLEALEVIGTLFSRWGKTLWSPIVDLGIPCHVLKVEDDADFVTNSLRFVAQHPYDIVHLSKPRFPNLVFGLLYQLVWGAQVIWDIDDEELAFAGGATPLTLAEATQKNPTLTVDEPLDNPFWTRLAVGEVGRFPVASVSNPALQKRYGGELIPHVRDEQRFAPKKQKRVIARKLFNIPESAKVVLFLGTPREHKGLVETAQGIASLKNQDIIFFIIGSFSKNESGKRLKNNLDKIKEVNIRYLEDQPFHQLPDILTIGDYCVLLQNPDSLVSNFQLPAKLVDALSMGMIVLAQETPAIQWLVKLNAVTPVTTDSFPAALQQQLNILDEQPQRFHNRKIFEQHLSISAVQPKIENWLTNLPHAPPPSWKEKLKPLLSGKLLPLFS